MRKSKSLHNCMKDYLFEMDPLLLHPGSMDSSKSINLKPIFTPIVSYISSPTYWLDKFLNLVTYPVVNTFELVDHMEDFIAPPPSSILFRSRHTRWTNFETWPAKWQTHLNSSIILKTSLPPPFHFGLVQHNQPRIWMSLLTLLLAICSWTCTIIPHTISQIEDFFRRLRPEMSHQQHYACLLMNPIISVTVFRWAHPSRYLWQKFSLQLYHSLPC